MNEPLSLLDAAKEAVNFPSDKRMDNLRDAIEREELAIANAEMKQGFASALRAQGIEREEQAAKEPILCPTCGGIGGVDSGGMTPWGSGINIPCPSCSSSREEQAAKPQEFPIRLTQEEEMMVKKWAEHDALWTTQETVEFNLTTFARAIIQRHAPTVSSQPWRLVPEKGNGAGESIYEGSKMVAAWQGECSSFEMSHIVNKHNESVVMEHELAEALRKSMSEISNLQTKLAAKEDEGSEGIKRRLVLRSNTKHLLARYDEKGGQ